MHVRQFNVHWSKLVRQVRRQDKGTSERERERRRERERERER